MTKIDLKRVEHTCFGEFGIFDERESLRDNNNNDKVLATRKMSTILTWKGATDKRG